MIELSHKVRELRLQLKIPAKALSEILEISSCNYYKKELGQIGFSLEEAKKIAVFFNKSVESIFFNTDSSKIEQ